MGKLFKQADSKVTRQTLNIFKNEISQDKKSLLIYSLLIPINRILFIVILPLLFSLIIQSLIVSPHNWQHPTVLLIIAVLVSIISVITSSIGYVKLFKHEEEMHTHLIDKAMIALSEHSDQFFADRKVGSLAGDVAKFGKSITIFLDIIFLSASGIAVNFIVSLIIIGIMSPVLLLPLGTITVLLVWRSVIGTIKRAPFRNKRKTMMSRLSGTIADILGNQQIVRYFAANKREIDRVHSDRVEIESVITKEIASIERDNQVRQSILFLFQIITMAICIFMYTNDTISIAALIFAITYLGRLTSSLFEISPIIRNMEQVFIDASDITEILAENPEVTDKPDASKLTVTDGRVQFDNVKFAYKDSSNNVVLRDINIDIKPGQKIGLAGHSGGGKTTLTKLLLRFADIQSGTIRIDGQNISDITQDSLRENIAYVPQEAYLFHRSLRENVAYSKPNASDSDIIHALKQANAMDFIETLPNGLDTIVGERGVKLSGGQRQRIAIARAILKDAPILLLDEATSALDSESEKLIQDALEELMKGRTSIVIAHRLSTIAKLDRIVVLDKGKVVEDGPHNTLLEQKGIYAKLWNHQSGGFIEE